MWKFCPAIAAGNAFILKPSERDPSVPLMLAELMSEAGAPDGILNVVNGDKGAVDAILDHPEIMAIGFVGSTPIAEYIYARGCANGKRVQCFGGAKNHMIIMPDADMDQAVDALIGAGYGAAGERCMAISVAVPVGEKTADLLIEKLAPRVEALKIGPYTAGNDVDFGPLVTSQARDRVLGLGQFGVWSRAPKLVVDGLRLSSMPRANEKPVLFSSGGLPVRPMFTSRHGHLNPRVSYLRARCCPSSRAPNYAEALSLSDGA